MTIARATLIIKVQKHLKTSSARKFLREKSSETVGVLEKQRWGMRRHARNAVARLKFASCHLF